MVSFLSSRDIPTGFIALGGHAIATAKVSENDWYMLDPDYGGVIPYDIKQAEALLFKSYEILGKDLLAVVNSKWSHTIKELPAYGKIQTIIDKNE